MDSTRKPSPSSSTNSVVTTISDEDDEESGSFFEVHEEHFLDRCFLCKQDLGGHRDIFMYRGDTPFCSEECRQLQIEIDEDDEMKVVLVKQQERQRSEIADADDSAIVEPPEIRARMARTIVAG